MHKCPFIIKHSLMSNAVGSVINMPSILLLSKNLQLHTMHAQSELDVTRVSYELCISSYEVIDQLKEKSVLASDNLLEQ